MHALRRIHEALVPGGVLLDMHPVPPSTRAEVDGKSLGVFDDSEFMRIVSDADAATLGTTREPARIREADGPVDIWERVVLRRFLK